jgi:ABC-2 type transport system ATP-binding protein
MNFAIETRQLSKRYADKVVVSDLNLQIPLGCVFGFLGPNGAGKTTTLRMLLGLVKPTSGNIFIRGRNALADPATVSDEVGAVIEVPTFFPYLNASENLAFFANCLVKPGGRTISDLLRLVGLDGVKTKVGKFSLGMKQRLGIASALLGDPRILFLDEPTNGLDPAGIREMLELIRNLSNAGKTIIYTSHLLGDVQSVCDRVGILDQGILRWTGKTEDLTRTREAISIHTGDEEKALRILSEAFQVRVDENRIIVETALSDAPVIVRALVAAEIDVLEVRPVSSGIEEGFFDVIKEGQP